MKKNLILLFVVAILAVGFLTGCFENTATTSEPGFDGVTIESDLVELVYAKKDFIKNDDGVITKVEVQYLFKNIAGRDIDFDVWAEFYDKDNNLIEKSDSKWFTLLEDYVENGELGISPANRIFYEGNNLLDVDHVIIKTEERV